MQPGSCGAGMPSLDVVSAFQSYGKYLEMGETEEAERVRLETVRHSCRKEGGACGGEAFLFLFSSVLHPFLSLRAVDRRSSSLEYSRIRDGDSDRQETEELTCDPVHPLDE